MGGHGDLNIKVRKDEEGAAKEEQLKRQQSRKHDTEFRIQQLRQACGWPSSSHQSTTAVAVTESPVVVEEAKAAVELKKSRHINLFEGIKIFDPVDNNNNKRKLLSGSDDDNEKGKEGFQKKKKEEVPIISPEDEKYRLGYGVAGKSVSNSNINNNNNDDDDDDDDDDDKQQSVRAAGFYDDDNCDSETVTTTNKQNKIKKESVEELREESLQREAKENERERPLRLQRPKGTRPVVSKVLRSAIASTKRR